MLRRNAPVLIAAVLVAGSAAGCGDRGRPKPSPAPAIAPQAARPKGLDEVIREAADEMARCGLSPREVEDRIKDIRAAGPDRPEWLDMFRAILDGEDLNPQFGWFRTAVARSRYDWDGTLRRFNRDTDLVITRPEFPGSDGDFTRLDRDHDGLLSRDDFDLASAPRSPSSGKSLFQKADRDGNGKVTREEFEAFFKAADTGSLGFLSGTDLEEILPAEGNPGGTATDGRPNKDTLLRGLFRQEFGSLQPGPSLEEQAPDFTLRTSDGKSEVTLSQVVGPRPVVLVFGNFTCGPFRHLAGDLEKLYRRYGDRANFLMVYVRETHPTDGWRSESNDAIGIAAAQPRTYEERSGVARQCGRLLGLGFPMLVDNIDDSVGARYSGMPGRFYLIDRAGKIAFKSGRGPFGFKPAELEHALILLLQEGKQPSGREPSPGVGSPPAPSTPSR